jgi:alkyl hydroperoxide reductase subunit AhpF
MATLINDQVKREVRDTFSQLRAPVRLVYFTAQHACGACAEQRTLLEELVALSDKVTLDVRELVADATEAARLGIDKVPATAVSSDRDYGIRFYGLTGGYEFGSLLEAIVMTSTGRSGLDPAVEAIARAIKTPDAPRGDGHADLPVLPAHGPAGAPARVRERASRASSQQATRPTSAKSR